MTTAKSLIRLKVLEFDAIGPAPFCAMMLADHGTEVTRITRPDPNFADQMNRENWPEMCKKVATAIESMDLDRLQRAVDTPDACSKWQRC